MPIEVNYKEVTILTMALLDTGASATFINGRVLDKIQQVTATTLERSDTISIKAALTSGSCQKFVDKFLLSAQGVPNISTEIYFLEQSPHGVIIGLPVMLAWNLVKPTPMVYPSEAAFRKVGEAHEENARTQTIYDENDFTEEEEIVRKACIKQIEQLLDVNECKRKNLVEQGKSIMINGPHVEFSIKHFDNVPPVWIRQYPLSQEKLDAFRDLIRLRIADGRCEELPKESKATYNNPYFVIPSNGGRKQRIVADYAHLNVGTVPIPYEIPLMSSMLRTGPGMLYTELDCKDAFPHIPLHADTLHKCTFTLDGKHYRNKCAELGLVNLSEHFQRVLKSIISHIPSANNYIDNIIVQHGPDMMSESNHELTFTSNENQFMSHTKEFNSSETQFMIHLEQIKIQTEEVCKVITSCTDRNVWFNKEKCLQKLLCRKVKSFGATYDRHGKGIDPTKLEEHSKYPMPSTVSEMRSFLQFVAFFRNHIRNFSSLTASLSNYTRKDQSKVITPDMIRDFDLLKVAAFRAPRLQNFDNQRPVYCQIDASATALGAIIYQPKNNKDATEDQQLNELLPCCDNIVMCCSRLCKGYELDWSIVKKEAATIAFVIQENYELIEASCEFVFLTDALSVYWLATNRHFDRTSAYWYCKLLEVPKIKFRWIPGKSNSADYLSRAYGTTWGVCKEQQEDFKQRKRQVSTMTTEQINSRIQTQDIDNLSILFCDLLVETVLPGVNYELSEAASHHTLDAKSLHELRNNLISYDEGIEINLLSNNLWNQNGKANEFHIFGEENLTSLFTLKTIIPSVVSSVPVSDSVDAEPISTSSNAAAAVSDSLSSIIADPNVPTRRPRSIPVPDDWKKIRINGVDIAYPKATSSQLKIVEDAHQWRHGAIAVTQAKCREKATAWPFQYHHIREVIDKCDVCNHWKRLHPVIVPSIGTASRQPMDDVQVDLISGLEESNGFNYVLVHTCVFSNFVILMPIIDKSSAVLAKSLFHIWSILGTPKTYQADNDRTMWAEAMQTVTVMFGVYHRKIAAYSPQRNGKVERKIQDVKMLIRKLTSQHGEQWSNILDLCQLALNSSSSSTLIPFDVMFGRKFLDFQTSLSPPDDYDNSESGSARSLHEWMDHMEAVQLFLFPFLREQKQHRQLVMQDDNNIKSSKHVAHETLAVGTNVRLLDPKSKLPGMKEKSPIEGIVSIVEIKGSNTYKVKDKTGHILERLVTRDQLDPLPYSDIIQEEDNHFQMDFIVAHKTIVIDGVREHRFKVRWQGYSPRDDTWEPASNLPADEVRKYIANANMRTPRASITGKHTNTDSTSI